MHTSTTIILNRERYSNNELSRMMMKMMDMERKGVKNNINSLSKIDSLLRLS